MFVKILKRCKKEISRKINQTSAYKYPPQQGGWEKYNFNPVLGNSETGTMFDPFVRWVNDRFVMCVSKRSDGTIYFYESFDGLKWDNPREILAGNNESSWESEVNRACFVMLPDKCFLYYTGQNKGKSCIGVAISKDGKIFKRVQQEPVIYPENAYENKATMNPCVLWDEKIQKFRMWYAAGQNYEPDVLCYAESNDGVNWIKDKAPVLVADKMKKYMKAKVGACDILQLNDGSFCLAFIAYQNIDVARIAIAYSEDGKTNWRFDKNNPILSPSKGEWDGHAVYKPTLCLNPINNKLMLWYNGRYAHNERIGAALLNRDFNVYNKE